MSSRGKPGTLGRTGIQFLMLLLMALGLATAVSAQSSTTGNITGTVRDQKGAAIPKTEVTIKDEKDGATRTVMTDDSGFYSAPSMPIGLYSVSASPQGFKKTVNTGLELHVGENLTVNLAVEVGAVTETVTVAGDATQVDTTSGEVSSLVSERQVTELPLNGRNYAALVTMIPGVSPANGGSFAARGTGLDSHVDMSVNGNQSNANMWTVDGVNNMDVGSNATLLVFPSIDSIKEFSVERNSFSAEYGQAQGAVINLITKGGGNSFHGTAFEFLRNSAFNAGDVFLNSGGQPRQQLRYNNFGFNVNGPIKKDRIFFFWSEEWRRERRGTVLPEALVPTAQERIGDFSGSLTDALPHLPNQPGVLFPGNKIPQNMLSPAALAILQAYPLPNKPRTAADGNNFVESLLEPVNTRQDLIRGDVTITSKMNLMVRFIKEGWTHANASNNFWGDSAFPTLTSDWDQPSRSFAAKLTNTLSANSVNEFQFSRAGNDIFISTDPAGQALNNTIASTYPTVFPKPTGVGLPTFWGADGYSALWHQAPWHNHEDLYIWKDDFSKVIGNHTAKFGALYSHNIKNEQVNGANSFSQFCGTNSRTGNAIADLLVKGLPLGCYTEVDQNEVGQGRWHDLEFYGNDSWKVRPRLTVNLGMRWSQYAQAYADNNHITNFIPALFDGKNPLSGLVTADQAGQFGLPRSLVNPYNRGFQPRVGIAWDIFGDGKTALRLGGGRYIARSNVIEDVLRMNGNPPWTTTVSSNWGGGSINLADDPTFRSLDSINSGLKNAVAGVGNNTAFNAVSTDFRPPESWQWNLTVSREVMRDTVVEVSYIGNSGTHLWRRGVSFNDILPADRNAYAIALRTNDPNAQNIANADRLFPNLGPVTMSESNGNSNYNALQVWVNRRFSNRLSFQGSYTWGRTISNVPVTSFTSATTDPFNFNLDHSDADLDRRNMLIGNAVYVLPSFERWGSFAKQFLGDWQFNTIATYLGGTPIDITSGANTAGLLGASTQRPDLVPGVNPYLNDPSRPLQFLNPAAFALPGAGKFGNLGRNSLRGPSVKNIDFSINKNWKMREHYGLQFRAELFNAFNNVNFGGLNTGLGFDNNSSSPTFGKALSGNFGTFTTDRGPREIQFGIKFSF